MVWRQWIPWQHGNVGSKIRKKTKNLVGSGGWGQRRGWNFNQIVLCVIPAPYTLQFYQQLYRGLKFRFLCWVVQWEEAGSNNLASLTPVSGWDGTMVPGWAAKTTTVNSLGVNLVCVPFFSALSPVDWVVAKGSIALARGWPDYWKRHQVTEKLSVDGEIYDGCVWCLQIV